MQEETQNQDKKFISFFTCGLLAAKI